MDIVNEVLSKTNKTATVSIQVVKLIEPDCFLKDLVVVDTNEVNGTELRENVENCLRNVSRDCVQILFNKLSTLPKENVDKGGPKAINVGSSPSFDLPREKPVPTPKPLTKWQKFAKEKGIRKTKKPRTTWDDVLQRWVPTYGYRKAAAVREKDWLLEVPQNKDPNTDMFTEKQKVRKENVAKNEYQRLRNLAAMKKIKVPSFGLPPLEGHMHAPQVEMAADIAKVSTASLGKFQPSLPNEKANKKRKNQNLPSSLKKKKTRPLNMEEERKSNLKLAEGITKKKPKLNIDKAVNKSIHQEQVERKDAKANEKKRGKRRKSKGGLDSKKGNKSKGLFKRPPANKGKRTGKQNKSGRKRR